MNEVDKVAPQAVQPVATRYRFILNGKPQKWEVGCVEMMDNPEFLDAENSGKFEMHPLYTHPTQQWLDERLLSLDAELLVEAKRALWRLSQDYEDGELRLRAQEHLECIDERRCVGQENIFNSHAVIAAQAKQGGK